MSPPKPYKLSKLEKRLEALALLKILELGDRQIEADQVQPAADVLARLWSRYRSTEASDRTPAENQPCERTPA